MTRPYAQDVYGGESWVPWPVNWSAVWIGALSGLAMALLFGLAGIALGAHAMGRLTREQFGFGALIFSVFGAFLSFVVAGWVAAKVGGVNREESAMLHGAVAWLVAVPLLLALAGFGASGMFGPWLSGLGGIPAWVTPPNVAVDPVAVRNSALGTLTALLLGLVGGVLGGWMGSGQPMTFGARPTHVVPPGRATSP